MLSPRMREPGGALASKGNAKKQTAPPTPMQENGARGGWATDCSGSPLGSSLLLLTAGNDGTLCLWDVARSAAQGRGMQPQQLAKCDNLHSGELSHLVLLGPW